MRIERCETRAVRVSFEGVMPGTHIAVRLRTSDGLEGVSYVSRVDVLNQRPLQALIEGYAASLAGIDVDEPPAIHARLLQSPLGAPVCGLELRAISAIDVALWDLRGKALGLPVHRLLGGARTRVPVSANWRLTPGPPRDGIARHVEDLQRRGFRALKCPVGLVPLDEAIAHVRFVRDCAGPTMRLIVDGNFRWSVQDALHFARSTEDCALHWIEDPVAWHDLDGLTQVTRAIRQRTCAGEAFQHPHEFRRLFERRASHFAMIDQDLGLTGFWKVAQMAEICGVPIVNHLAPEVLAHGVAAAPNGHLVGLVPWAQPLFTEPLRVEEGDLVLSERPGLGLSFDEDVIARCAVG